MREAQKYMREAKNSYERNDPTWHYSDAGSQFVIIYWTLL